MFISSLILPTWRPGPESSLPPSPACEPESPLEIVPRSLEDLGRGHLGMGPVERAQQLGRFGAGRLAPGTGATAGMCSAGPRESLHLVRLSLGLPGTNQPALGRQKGSLRPGSPGPGVEFQDLEWYLPPRLPSPVLPQLLRRPPSPPQGGHCVHSLCLSHCSCPAGADPGGPGGTPPRERFLEGFTPGAQVAVGNESHMGWLWACRGQDTGGRRAPGLSWLAAMGPSAGGQPSRSQFSCL